MAVRIGENNFPISKLELRLRIVISMIKRKPGNTDQSCRAKPEPILLTENFETQLYYIASNDNLLKDLTMSFYNMETRNNHKKIVTETVGTVTPNLKSLRSLRTKRSQYI